MLRRSAESTDGMAGLLRNALLHIAAGVFRAAKCITGQVECISSENPINAELWPKTVAASTVLVMTAQAFLNMLESGRATLHAFDLIVGSCTAN